MNAKILIKIVFIGLVLFGCATTKVREKEHAPVPEKISAEQEMNVDVIKINSWINLMPGTDPRFNISGEIEIKPKNSDYQLMDLLFTEIKIKQNGKTVYFIKPTVREETGKKDLRKLLFSTIKGLSITPDLNPDKHIDVELIFDDDGDELKYVIRNVKVEKIY